MKKYLITICILILCAFSLWGCQQKDISDKSVMKEIMDDFTDAFGLSCEKEFKKISIPMNEEIIDYSNQKGVLENWIGKYQYTAVFEGEIEGYRPVIAFEIEIYKNKGKYFADISIDGWQSQSHSLAYVEGDSKTIRLIFKETLKGDVLYGSCSRYDEGDILLSFSYDEDTLKTIWLEMKGQLPDFIELNEKAEGKYFEKYDENIRGYIDNAAYEELKEVLEQVDWCPQFELGEEEELEFHLQKYRELLLMEREYVNRANGEQATLDHLISRQINEPDGSYLYYDMETNNYYIYDFDGDGAQELCIELITMGINYIFKYDKQTDEVYLWFETGKFSQLGGTRTVFGGDKTPEHMYVLDEYGKPENTYTNYCDSQNIIIIPCKNKQGELIVSDMLYEKSYHIEDGDGRGYFYVTEEQFKVLAQYMRDGRAWAEKEIKKYQYTYNDLILE